MKAYKITDNKDGSCILGYKNSFYTQYKKDETVEFGLVFKGLENALEFFRKVSSLGIKPWYRLYEVECDHLEPCDMLTFLNIWSMKKLLSGKTINRREQISVPYGTRWGFGIRLVKLLRES